MEAREVTAQHALARIRIAPEILQLAAEDLVLAAEAHELETQSRRRLAGPPRRS